MGVINTYCCALSYPVRPCRIEYDPIESSTTLSHPVRPSRIQYEDGIALHKIAFLHTAVKFSISMSFISSTYVGKKISTAVCWDVDGWE